MSIGLSLGHFISNSFLAHCYFIDVGLTIYIQDYIDFNGAERAFIK